MAKKLLVLLVLAFIFNLLSFSIIGAWHYFVMGLNPFLGLIVTGSMMLLSLLVLVFGGRWIVRRYKGTFNFSPTAMFVMGFFVFLMGGFLYSIFIGKSTLDVQLHDTYFVLASEHVSFLAAILMLVFSGIYFSYPRIVGRLINTRMGWLHFVLTLLPVYFLVFHLSYEGLAGMPRRYISYSEGSTFSVWSFIDDFQSRMVVVLIFAQLLFIVNMGYSAVWGKKWSNPTLRG